MVAAGDRVDAADITSIENYTTERPLVVLVQATVQSISDATDTAITFGTGSEEIDTHGFHSDTTNTSRVTPTVAGYYRVFGKFHIGARADFSTITAFVFKNGGVVTRERVGPNATALSRTVTVTKILSLNGSTDYVELYGNQDNAANVAVSTSTGSFACTLEVEFLRPT